MQKIYSILKQVISADIETSKRYYESRYNNLPETEKDNITNNFDEIINLDPTQNKKYLKWISNLILSNKVLKSDYYKIPELLQKFDKLVLKKQIPIPDNQITRYKSIPELYQKLQEYEEVDIRSPKELKEDIYQNTLFFEGNKFNIYIPTSYEESCKLGSGTNWCTATGNTRSYYDYYSKQGNLYIFINKSNPKEKYQLFLEGDKEFKDLNDKEIENINMFRDDKVIMDWLKNNLDNNLKLRYNFSWKEMGYPEIWKGDLDLRGNKTLTDLGQLKEIKGSAYFENSNIEDLGKLTSIGGWADFENSQIKSLGNLTSIGGDVYFENSQIKNLGKLTSIGGWADFYNSNIEDLGQLTRIGGNAYFYNSNIEDLGNLKEIGGKINWGNRTDLKEQWEKRQTKAMKKTAEPIDMVSEDLDIEELDTNIPGDLGGGDLGGGDLGGGDLGGGDMGDNPEQELPQIDYENILIEYDEEDNILRNDELIDIDYSRIT